MQADFQPEGLYDSYEEGFSPEVKLTSGCGHYTGISDTWTEQTVSDLFFSPMPDTAFTVAFLPHIVVSSYVSNDGPVTRAYYWRNSVRGVEWGASGGPSLPSSAASR